LFHQLPAHLRSRLDALPRWPILPSPLPSPQAVLVVFPWFTPLSAAAQGHSITVAARNHKMTITNNNKINSSHATRHQLPIRRAKKNNLNGLAPPVSAPHARVRASYPLTVRLGFRHRVPHSTRAKPRPQLINHTRIGRSTSWPTTGTYAPHRSALRSRSHEHPAPKVCSNSTKDILLHSLPPTPR
jgi:hypothetical protein